MDDESQAVDIYAIHLLQKNLCRLCAVARVALILSIQKIGYSIRDVNIEYSSSFCKMVYLASLVVYKATIHKGYQDCNSDEI